MAKTDDSFGKAEDEELPVKPFNKKKVLIFVLPIIIVIGLAVSFITVFTRSKILTAMLNITLLPPTARKAAK